MGTLVRATVRAQKLLSSRSVTVLNAAFGHVDHAKSKPLSAHDSAIHEQVNRFFIDPHYGKEISNKKKDFPDPLGEAVGIKRYEFLTKLLLFDDDPFETRVISLEPKSSKEVPNLVPSNDCRRQISCICNDEETFEHYLMLFKGVATRCNCGHYFKLVDYDEYFEVKAARSETRMKELEGKPESKAEVLNLKEQLHKLLGLRDQLLNVPGAPPIVNKEGFLTNYTILVDNYCAQYKAFRDKYSL